MKWTIFLCLLAVYSAQAMPSKDDAINEEEVKVNVKKNKKDHDYYGYDYWTYSFLEEYIAIYGHPPTTTTTTGIPYTTGNYEEYIPGVHEDYMPGDSHEEYGSHGTDSSSEEKKALDIDVNVNVNVPQKKTKIDIDVNVNVNAEEEEEEENEGVPSDLPRQGSCECSTSLKDQAIDLTKDVNQLLNTLYELKEKAAANNVTIGSGPRTSAATSVLTDLENDVSKTAAALTKMWHYYCYWKYYYFWWFSWKKYVCSWYFGRKKRSSDFEEMNNEEPTCINLASVLLDVAEEIKQATELRDTVTNDSALSAHVLLSIDQTINTLLEYLPFVNDLTNDLNDLPC